MAELQTLFDRFESPLVEGWQAEDVLVEVMLMEGFPLDSATEPLPEFTRNTVTRVSSDLVAHRLFVCLDAAVHDETIAALGFEVGPGSGRGGHLHLSRQRADGRGEGAAGGWEKGEGDLMS